MQETDVSGAKQRVLDTAETLFMQRLQCHHASGHRCGAGHTPELRSTTISRGKEQLYVESGAAGV
ncbi:MAG: hypothetical protein R2838_21565 [Caldilineaceae bacterium]